MQPYAASDSELPEEIFNKRSPRASLSANEDDNPSGTTTPRRKFSKFHIGKGRKPFRPCRKKTLLTKQPYLIENPDDKNSNYFP